jgi:hypothetical protein
MLPRLILVRGLAVFLLASTVVVPRGKHCLGDEFDDAHLEKVVITEGFKPYLEKAPNLLQGGSHIFVDGNDWVAIAVGVAPLENESGKRIVVRDAKKAARSIAQKDLVGALSGVKRSAEEHSSMISDQSGGSARIREYFLTLSRQEIKATLQRAEVTGTWFMERNKFVAIMVAVGNPGNPLLEASSTKQTKDPGFSNVTVESPWREVFWSHTGILTGGASLYQQGNGVIIMAVGSARMTGDPVNAIQRERVARAMASREVLQFVQGLQIRAQDEARLTQVRLTAEEKTIFESTREAFKSLVQEKVHGIVRMLKPVGSWHSKKGDYFYQAFVVRLAELQ